MGDRKRSQSFDDRLGEVAQYGGARCLAPYAALELKAVIRALEAL